MNQRELNSLIDKSDLSEVYHASMVASGKGLSAQARVLWNLAERLRDLHGLNEDVRWRDYAKQRGGYE